MQVSDAQWDALLEVFWEAHDKPEVRGVERVYGGIRAVLAELPDVPQPGPTPDRQELAQAIRKARYESLGCTVCEWSEVEPDSQKSDLAGADKAIELCAGRVPSEVWAVLADWRERAVGWRRGGDGSRATGIEELAYAVEAALKSVPRPAPDLRGLIAGLRESARHHQHDHDGEEYHLGLGQGLLESASHVENMLDHPELNAVRAKRSEPAPRALPTRAEIAGNLASFYDREISTSAAYLAEADYVLSLLREHAAPSSASGEVEALRAQLDEALAKLAAHGDAVISTSLALGKAGIPQTAYACDADRVACLAGQRDAARGEAQHYQAELNECQDALEKALRERDEARTRLEVVEQGEDEAIDEATGLRQQIAKLEEVVDENKRKADDHRRQRDEARAQSEHWQLEHTSALCRAQQAEAQLAARSEPVELTREVTDEIAQSYWGSDSVCPRPQRDRMRNVILGMFGDRVSVAGPHSEPARGVMVRDVHRAMDVLTAAGIPTNRADGCFMKLHKRVQALAEERDQLRAKIAQYEADAEVSTRAVDRLRADLAYSRKTCDETLAQRDHLRAGVEDVVDWAFQHVNRATPEGTKQRGYVECAQEAHRQLCALLWPGKHERVSAAGPADPHNDARRFEERLKQEIAYCKTLVQERDRLRAELQAAQAEVRRLGHCVDQREEARAVDVERLSAALRSSQTETSEIRRKLVQAGESWTRCMEERDDYSRLLDRERERHTRLHEEHEALRAGVEYGCEALERHDGPENKTTAWYAERFRALLKPSTPEAPPGRHDWQHLKSAVGGGQPTVDTFRCVRCGETSALEGFAKIDDARAQLSELGCSPTSATAETQALGAVAETRPAELARMSPFTGEGAQHPPPESAMVEQSELSTAPDAGTEETGQEYARRRLRAFGAALESATSKALAESRIVLGPGQDNPIVPDERPPSLREVWRAIDALWTLLDTTSSSEAALAARAVLDARKQEVG